MFSYPHVSKDIKGQPLPLVPPPRSLGVFGDLGGHTELAFKLSFSFQLQAKFSISSCLGFWKAVDNAGQV